MDRTAPIRALKRFVSSNRGSSAAEFALTLPLLVFMILGVINVCLITLQTVRMQHAARDAARCVMIGAPCTPDTASVNTYATGRWTGLGKRPTFTWSSAGCGNTVVATVDPYKLVTGLGNFSFKLQSKACYPLQTV